MNANIQGPTTQMISWLILAALLILIPSLGANAKELNTRISTIDRDTNNQNDNKILLVRTQHEFKSTLEIVKEVLKDNNFTVAHVQRCDGGLKGMGYHTDKYQIVFFGRKEEVAEISKSHIEFIPFLPLKLLIYAEGNESVISIINPEALGTMMKDKSLSTQLTRWKKEFMDILKQIQDS